MFKKKTKKYEPAKFSGGPKAIQCFFCGEMYETEFVFGPHENCTRRRDRMTWAQYIQILENLKAVIEAGEDESHWNSDYTGDKDSACSWGLCTKNPAVYPDPDMHIWPWQNEAQGRHAPNYRAPGQHCPMRHNWEHQAFGKPQWEATPGGCFYDCSFFSPNGRPRPTRQDAINLIDARIRLVQQWLSTSTVGDSQ